MAAKKKTSQTPKRPRIFVQIASYRDPECQWTVRDLFEKATYPERIFVGICWQFIKGEDDAFFAVPYPRPKQVRVHEVDARESKGVCWARSLTQKLWKGEEFTLQIDSHMRFEKGWDETLLSMWNECGSKKAVLTSYPPGYTPPDQCERGWVFGMAAKEFDKDGIFLMHGKPAFTLDKLPEKPIPGAFASACMYFGPGRLIEDVPYDPYLYFFGEEISLAVRFWTHGYDLFHPNKPFIYHNWVRAQRKTHFDDHDWGSMNQRAFRRVRHMLGTDISTDPNITKELDTYGLGSARTLEQYQAYSGVDFSTKIISDYAYEGVYERFDPAKKHIRPLPKIFVNIASYRDRECQWTVKDLFEKAKHPDRVNVGICWQFDEKLDQDCFMVSTREEQVRVNPVDWRESEGVCWARHQAQQLWEGEEYVLQIDAHTRFASGWDDLLIAELNACKAEKPLLSCSPAGYTPPNQIDRSTKAIIQRALPFTSEGYIASRGEPLDHAPPAPLNGAFISSAFIFARAALWQEVPIDPYLYNDEEEMAYAIRLYTHGWDVFSPSKTLLYHYYNSDPTTSVRPLHDMDLEQKDQKKLGFLQHRSARRLEHLTGFQWSKEPEVIQDFTRYDVGRARALQQFEFYSGVDFRRRTVSEKALRAEFIHNLATYLQHPIVVEVESRMAVGQSGGSQRAHDAMQKPVLVSDNKPSILLPPEPRILAGSGVVMQNQHATAQPTTSGGHMPKLVFKSKEAEVYDDFLPEDLYQRVLKYVNRLSYERINTHGKVSRAWHIHDNFPLRSAQNVFYYSPSVKKAHEHYMYPTKTDMDLFIEQIVSFSPHIEHIIGAHDKDWGHVTATAWLYPPGTGLAMHDDGSGTYAGAYAYFLNPIWRSSWGGLNIMMDREANDAVYAYRAKNDQMEFYERNWLDNSILEELMLEHGMGKCIFPKKNRIVFISNYAYHMVTRVNEAAGDNIRTSIAGFFNFKHVSESHGDQKKDGHY